MKRIPYRTYLTEEQLPKYWYNIRADLKEKCPPLINPLTGKEAAFDELTTVFTDEGARQELNNIERYVEIPKAVRHIYTEYRPAPLIRAYNVEKALNTPARIYYKFEGNNTSGSHKLNSAIPQAYYAKQQGLKRVTTETGAGQWGTAMSEACAYFGLDLEVFMVKVSYEQKPFRKTLMKVFGGNVTPSPSMLTAVGRQINTENPGTGGSLGCAIAEAVEVAKMSSDSRYVLGSVLNQVALHQSVIGLESKTALEMYDEYPDMVIGCAGGGSNLIGLASPFLKDKLEGKANPEIIAVEPASCPSLTRGKYAYDYCDTGRITPLAKMYTLGNGFIPSPGHAGGLRFHGMSPIISQLYHQGYMKAIAVKQTDVFEAAIKFAKLETILPAPESSHAIYAAMKEAEKCRETGEAKTILFGLTGTGFFDMTAYDAFLSGNMTDRLPADSDLEKGFSTIPKIEGVN